MTQRNINAMDMVVDKIAEGAKLSEALKTVYKKRSICIPYTDDNASVLIVDLGLSMRAANALLRSKLDTIAKVVEFCNEHKITEIKNLGRGSGIEIFEAILDYSWEHMSEKERVIFLIDTVERNEDYIREEIA